MYAQRGLFLCLGAAVLTFAGCRPEEGIQQYRVPRIEKPLNRLLAVVVPLRDETYFFKVVGPKEEVASREKEFDAFVDSLTIHNREGQPITWTLPTGWAELPKWSPNRYATLRLGPEGSELEMTVNALGAGGGSLLDNVNRWRGQLSLGEVDEAELKKLVEERKIAGKTVQVVRMDGFGSGKTKMPPFAGGRPPIEAPRLPETPTPQVKFKTPEGWQEAARPAMFSVATLDVREGDQTARTTISPLAGAAGGLEPNVNRWRGQLGLAPVSPEELRKELKELEVGGVPAKSIDLVGPEGAKRQRILAVVLEHSGKTWFLKMQGPADLVAKQKSAFESFVKSVKFDAGTGADR